MTSSIQERLKAIASGNGSLPYLFGSMAQLNVLLDKLSRQSNYPVCINIQPVEGDFTFTTGVYDSNVYDEPHIMIGYGDRIRLDYDAERVEQVVEALKLRCKRLVTRLNAEPSFGTIDTVTYSVMFDRMDANLVIVLMDFRLPDTEGVCVDELTDDDAQNEEGEE